jgi:hypothetical protein
MLLEGSVERGQRIPEQEVEMVLAVQLNRLETNGMFKSTARLGA